MGIVIVVAPGRARMPGDDVFYACTGHLHRCFVSCRCRLHPARILQFISCFSAADSSIRQGQTGYISYWYHGSQEYEGKSQTSLPMDEPPPAQNSSELPCRGMPLATTARRATAALLDHTSKMSFVRGLRCTLLHTHMHTLTREASPSKTDTLLGGW